MSSVEPADLRLRTRGDIDRGAPLKIYFNGEAVAAYEGETVAAALMAAGKRWFRYTKIRRQPRGVYCGMGVCYDCLAIIDDCASRRACMSYVSDGMRVETQHGWGSAE